MGSGKTKMAFFLHLEKRSKLILFPGLRACSNFVFGDENSQFFA